MAYDPDTDTDSADESPVLPTDRHTGCPFDPPPALTALSDRPVRRLRYADGHVGRLVTGHAAARAVLADPRFSSRYELLHLPVPMEGAPGGLPPAPVGDMTGLDAPEHTRYRRLLAGRFTVRSMRQPTGHIERFTADCLDAMEQAGPTDDLLSDLAAPGRTPPGPPPPASPTRSLPGSAGCSSRPGSTPRRTCSASAPSPCCPTPPGWRPCEPTRISPVPPPGRRASLLRPRPAPVPRPAARPGRDDRRAPGSPRPLSRPAPRGPVGRSAGAQALQRLRSGLPAGRLGDGVGPNCRAGKEMR